MYDIRWGRVGVYAAYGTPQEKKLAELGAEDFFGEMGLLDREPRSATVVALEDGTSVQEITSGEFSAYFKDSPDKLLSVMRQMSSRLRETNKNYLEAVRTVYDTVEAEKKGEEKSGGLLSRLNFFHGVYKKSKGK